MTKRRKYSTEFKREAVEQTRQPSQRCGSSDAARAGASLSAAVGKTAEKLGAAVRFCAGTAAGLSTPRARVNRRLNRHRCRSCAEA